MKITAFIVGSGPNLTPDVRRGDSFVPLEGDHLTCNAPTVVMGLGLTSNEEADGYEDALLVRCTKCLGSYTLTENNT